ncbi:MAG: hypothetical protein R3E58_04775 [Phycisphaerae bacterium]
MDDNTLIMRPQAGDDLIVWGDSETVYYIVPSESSDETDAGIEVPEGERFAWTHFAVAGKKIALVTSLGNVRVYDTATGQSKEFSTSDLLLRNTQMNDDRLPGLTQASGNLFATINDTNQVADGNAIKVIDVAGSDPNAWKVISFPIRQAALMSPSRRSTRLQSIPARVASQPPEAKACMFGILIHPEAHRSLSR